jgi:sirohydrochlorin cobaltochelatase
MMKKITISAFLALCMAFSYGQEKTVGVLVLAHGAGQQWNQQVLDMAKEVAAKYPTEVAFGMALPRTMQEGIDKLEARGVQKIVVVPLFISSHSFIIRQSEYLLGLREKLADPPMVMDHSSEPATGSSHNGSHGSHGSMDHGSMNHGASSSTTTETSGDLPRLNIRSEIRMARALDDNPLVAQILSDRIAALSKKPSSETVILVGHGPNPEDDNLKWVNDMESLAAQIRGKQEKAGKPFKMILCATVRDDADPAMYNQAKENLRSLVRQGSQQGDVLVIPVFLSSGSVEQKVASRLEGLRFVWNGKTLLPDTRIIKFVLESVEQQLKR